MTYTLGSVMPASKPPRPRWVVPLVVFLVVAALILAGLAVVIVRGLMRPTSAPAATGSASAPTSTGLRDPDAVKGCQEIDKADLADLELLERVGSDAALATIFDIHVAGALLHDNARLAIAAAGQPDGPELRDRVVTAAKSLRATCVRTGYLAN